MPSLSAIRSGRESIPVELTWNLGALFPSDLAWEQARQDLLAVIPELRRRRGTLCASAEQLAEALELRTALDSRQLRLSTYASLRCCEDTRCARTHAMCDQAAEVSRTLRDAGDFIDESVVELGEDELAAFIAAEPRLGPYRLALEEVQRRAAHRLPVPEERLLSAAERPLASITRIYHGLINAIVPPVITLPSGSPASVDEGTYIELRASPFRETREAAVHGFFKSLGAHSQTFGAIMDARVQHSVFLAGARRYPSTLAMYLDAIDIPVELYDTCVAAVHRALPTLHRYLKLRRRMLGVDALHYYDLYAPAGLPALLPVTPADAKRHVMDAVAPLGAAYMARVERAFDERWIDWLPHAGKPWGAFTSTALYGGHAFACLNFRGTYEDLSALAHEVGHMMHASYANDHQPLPLADYHLCVAEVASTFCEDLLARQMRRLYANRREYMEVLFHCLERFRITVFRQTLFAEVQLRLHAIVQSELRLDGDTIAEVYLQTCRRYYGHDDGVCTVSEDVAHEWSCIPHLLGGFSVFQYATAFVASTMLAEQCVRRSGETESGYLRLLAAGGSKRPLDLLSDAGVNLLSEEPYEAAFARMDALIAELESNFADSEGRVQVGSNARARPN